MKNDTNKPYFTIDMTHSEGSFMVLAHTQYDLFCKRNYLVRTLIAVACAAVAAFHLEDWWAYILIVYAVYLFTGKYNQANHTARKLVKGIKDAGLKFPSSRYVFTDDMMRVFSMPDREELPGLKYEDVYSLGKDRDYYYVFRDKHGGYMMPREVLGDRDKEFAQFISEKTGLLILTKRTPPYKKGIHYLKQKGWWPGKRG